MILQATTKLKYLYTFIFHPFFNRILRSIFFVFKSFIPEKYWLHPSGRFSLSIPGNHRIHITINQTSYIGRTLYYLGSQEYEYSAIFSKLITRVNCFFDVGANFGYYALLGARLNPNLAVYAFEPAEGPFYYLNNNIELNHFEGRIFPFALALSNQTGEAIFHTIQNPKYPEIYNLSGEHNLGTKKHIQHCSTRVKTQTLDNFVEQHCLSTIDLIKMDTEGNEHHILAHAEKCIRIFEPILICEVLFNTIESELDELIKKFGYKIYKAKGNYLYPTHSLLRNEDDGVRNCFFVPLSKEHLISDLLG